jgi:hypothetical protein
MKSSGVTGLEQQIGHSVLHPRPKLAEDREISFHDILMVSHR